MPEHQKFQKRSQGRLYFGGGGDVNWWKTKAHEDDEDEEHEQTHGVDGNAEHDIMGQRSMVNREGNCRGPW